ncbi:MAG TPA: hypothetical protein VK638_13675 [Edaphobacter sp.]|nr:hypothetical protein [Edaphobacter sp.]
MNIIDALICLVNCLDSVILSGYPGICAIAERSATVPAQWHNLPMLYASCVPQSFDVKWKGADWEVVVRIKSTDYGDPEKDFTEELPE